ncbi:MAG: TrbG/VirB9 family P-type conjugative transfer protein [Rickettsiales endosymbiont of Dermacentor nuttalli]
MSLYKTIFITICLFIITSFKAYGDVPITTDSRIKTYIYNENEVFLMLVHYGYQSSIEFGLGEEVETISVGDSYAWKITPVGRRLFIKPLEENMHTNMTVITNKRTYQFDIMSKLPDESFNKDLVYVVRFFYPYRTAGNRTTDINNKSFN